MKVKRACWKTDIAREHKPFLAVKRQPERPSQQQHRQILVLQENTGGQQNSVDPTRTTALEGEGNKMGKWKQ